MKQLTPVIAVAGQKDFDLPGLAAPALITVNGVILQPVDFSIDGEVVALTGSLAEGDEVGAIVFGKA